MEPAIPELAGRSLTLHVDSAPVSRVVAQVLAALEAQTELVADKTSNPQSNPRAVDIRLADGAMSRLRLTVQMTNLSVVNTLSCVCKLYGKATSNITNWGEIYSQINQADVLINVSIVNATRAEAAGRLRAALAQQAAIILDEQPDGNFTARLATPPQP